MTWNFSGWNHAAAVSLIIFTFAILYGYFFRQTVNIAVVSESFAFTGGVLIGLSFILAPVSYFFNFADKELRYRKFLGLIGYYYALFYCFSLQIRFPDKYLFGLANSLSSPEVILGLAAMGIFTLMALVSGPVGMKALGKNWRYVLRTGYLAYFLLIIRAIIVEGEVWMTWLNRLEGLPPPRFLLTIFATFVILVRVVMLLHQAVFNKKTY